MHGEREEVEVLEAVVEVLGAPVDEELADLDEEEDAAEGGDQGEEGDGDDALGRPEEVEPGPVAVPGRGAVPP